MSWNAARAKRWPWNTESEYAAHWLERIRAQAVRSETGCLEWQGFCGPTGYGQTNYRGKTTVLHRKLYSVAKGVELRRDQHVCHTCDNRLCIEITHLWVGTNKQNLTDCKNKGRLANLQKTHCDRGHPFTDDNVYLAPTAAGGVARNCQVCTRARNRIKAGWTPEIAYLMPRGMSPF